MVVAFATSRTNKDNVNVWTTWDLPGVGQDGSEQQSNQISNMWRRSILAYSMAIAHKSGLSAHCCNILHPLAGFPDMKTKSLPMSRFLHLSTLGIFYPSQSIPFNTISSQIRCASLLHIILHLARLWRKKLSIIQNTRSFEVISMWARYSEIRLQIYFWLHVLFSCFYHVTYFPTCHWWHNISYHSITISKSFRTPTLLSSDNGFMWTEWSPGGSSSLGKLNLVKFSHPPVVDPHPGIVTVIVIVVLTLILAFLQVQGNGRGFSSTSQLARTTAL